MDCRSILVRGTRALALGLLVGAVVLVQAAVQAQGNPEVIHSFDNNIPGASVGLIKGPDGLLYGASTGGAHGWGVVYRVLPGGELETLHEFSDPDGRIPYGLALGTDGNFYGVTSGGGDTGNGTIYRVSAEGKFKRLHSFSNTDGRFPRPLVAAKDGWLYGTTAFGGKSFIGVAYRIKPDGRFELLHEFTGEADDSSNPGGLVEGSDGLFYGVGGGGKHGGGAIFKMHRNGQVRILHSFWRDGREGFPSEYEPLTEGPDGAFYGVGYGRHGHYPHGLIFRIDPQGHYTAVYDFPKPRKLNGRDPAHSLALGHDGAFYGTTSYGSDAKLGATIFRLTPDGTLMTLYHFDDYDTIGILPGSRLLEVSDGVLVGTTEFGGAGHNGAIFRFTVTAD